MSNWVTLSETEPRPDLRIWSRSALDAERVGYEPLQVKRKAPAHRPPLTKTQERDIVREYKSGVSIKKLARKHHRAHTTISALLREQGVVFRG